MLNDPNTYTSSFSGISFNGSIFDFFASIYPPLVYFFKSLLGVLVGLSIPASLFFVIGIIYCVEQLKIIRKKEAEIHDLKVEMAYEVAPPADHALAQRWEKITKNIESDNLNDWKQAIMEADIILDEILTRMGYRGESVGEKLKRAEPGDIQTLNEAWEAHKVRNQIAHEGSEFNLNQHEAKRVIHMYRKVFEEFYYV
jgi:hypothetical protein